MTRDYAAEYARRTPASIKRARPAPEVAAERERRRYTLAKHDLVISPAGVISCTQCGIVEFVSREHPFTVRTFVAMQAAHRRNNRWPNR